MPLVALMPQAILPIDVIELVAVFMGTSIVLIPVIGLTARFALKPTVEALSKVLDKRGLDDTVQILEQRMSLLEKQIDNIESNVSRLVEVSEFHHQLGSGAGDEKGTGGDAG